MPQPNKSHGQELGRIMLQGQKEAKKTPFKEFWWKARDSQAGLDAPERDQGNRSADWQAGSAAPTAAVGSSPAKTDHAQEQVREVPQPNEV